jgi:LmbE family N-acetylglucosaminyl deacetylase
MDIFLSNDPQPVETYKIDNSQRILVLAPHPDDFDAIGVSLRYFDGNRNPIYLAVATSGASGVEDSFCSPPTREAKGKLREEEQRASCRYFGLPEENLTFLRLEEDQEGHTLEDKHYLLIIHDHFM